MKNKFPWTYQVYKSVLMFFISIIVLSPNLLAMYAVEEGSYTIRNRGLSVGLLSWTFNEAPSGHLSQVLQGGAYPDEKEKYFPGGRYRDHILWDIVAAEDGAYTIKNRGLSVGLLSWTGTEAPSGHFSQVLQGGAYPDEREKYLPGGRYRNDILWELTRTND